MTRALTAVAALIAAVTLSGCLGVGLSRKHNFQVDYKQQQVSLGDVTEQPTSRIVAGQVVKGSFSAKLDGKATISRKKKKVRKLRIGAGSFVAKYGGTADFNTQVAKATGLQLVTFDDKATGSMCARMNFTTSDHGKTYSGTFESVGGTGHAAYARVKGGFTETPSSATTSAMRGSATAKTGKRKGLTADCKALRAL